MNIERRVTDAFFLHLKKMCYCQENNLRPYPVNNLRQKLRGTVR